MPTTVMVAVSGNKKVRVQVVDPRTDHTTTDTQVGPGKHISVTRVGPGEHISVLISGEESLQVQETGDFIESK